MKLDIRSQGLPPPSTFQDHAERRLSFALGRLLRGRAAHVSLMLTDQNGPRGGVDKDCRVVLRAGETVIVTHARDADVFTAIDLAARRLAHALSRHIDRTRDHLRHVGPVFVPS
jgi:ribosomal subunit interface protein